MWLRSSCPPADQVSLLVERDIGRGNNHLQQIPTSRDAARREWGLGACTGVSSEGTRSTGDRKFTDLGKYRVSGNTLCFFPCVALSRSFRRARHGRENSESALSGQKKQASGNFQREDRWLQVTAVIEPESHFRGPFPHRLLAVVEQAV